MPGLTRPPRRLADGPLVVAHRGASSAEPENTVIAFEAAAAAGADVIELDVRLTSDGAAVVLHDGDLSVTTDGDGLVHARTLAEVKKLDASGGRGPRQEVPMLAEALDAASRGGVGINAEIKNIPGEPSFDSPREAALEATLRALDETGFPGPLLVSSFNWITIERSKELAPDVPTGFLTTGAIDPAAALVYARGAGHDFVLPHAPALLEAGASFVKEVKEAGLRVGTWTVDDEETLVTLYSWGVDAVASNRPDLAVAVRDRIAGRA